MSSEFFIQKSEAPGGGVGLMILANIYKYKFVYSLDVLMSLIAFSGDLKGAALKKFRGLCPQTPVLFTFDDCTSQQHRSRTDLL